MSELSFLIELLLNHDLPAGTKELIASRIRQVEMMLTAKPATGQFFQTALPGKATQAPSTLAAMARHGDTILEAPVMPPIPEAPVTQIAQTPATAAAMNSRHEAIAASLAGKVDKVSGRPRKW